MYLVPIVLKIRIQLCPQMFVDCTYLISYPAGQVDDKIFGGHDASLSPFQLSCLKCRAMSVTFNSHYWFVAFMHCYGLAQSTLIVICEGRLPTFPPSWAVQFPSTGIPLKALVELPESMTMKVAPGPP